MTDDLQWIDALSEPAVTLAAYVWKKDPAETWGILSRAIKAEQLSNPIPFPEFQAYIQHFVPTPTDSTNYKTLFEYYIERHGLQDGKEKILSAFNGDYKKATQRLSHFNFPIHSPTISTKPAAGFPPLIPNPPQPKYPLLEKILAAVGTTIAVIFWLAFAVFFVWFSFSYSDGSYDVPEPTDIREKNYEEYLYDFPTPEPDEPDYFNEDIYSPTSCLIKGNISFDTGEKIYHLPGQEFYNSTIIDTSQGERWFCTEAEAQSAGWRKSRQ